MGLAKKLDFVLYEDDTKRIKLRLFPRMSEIRRANYTVIADYSWEIIEYQLSTNDDGDKEVKSFEVVFKMPVDTDSSLYRHIIPSIDEVATNENFGHECIKGEKPGSDWMISRDKSGKLVKFQVFHNERNYGYRFYLPLDRCDDFIKYLKMVNEHMLRNGGSEW